MTKYTRRQMVIDSTSNRMAYSSKFPDVDVMEFISETSHKQENYEDYIIGLSTVAYQRLANAIWKAASSKRARLERMAPRLLAALIQENDWLRFTDNDDKLLCEKLERVGWVNGMTWTPGQRFHRITEAGRKFMETI